eukprot:613293-Heterocapsa_arctica.AAC.1
MEQGKAQIAENMKRAQQDTINTRQENENYYIHIWSANRSFLEDVKIQGVNIGPNTSAQMTNESL